MQKWPLAGVGALLSVALTANGPALAKGTFTVTLADYNAALVAADADIITVPYGATVGGTTYTADYAVTSGTTLESGSRFTITLPAGFTFDSQPSLTMLFMGSASLFSGGIGSQIATFQITADTVGDVLINGFAVKTTAAFAGRFAGQPLSMSVQATNNVLTTNDDLTPLSQPAFVSAVGALPETSVSGGGQIDLAFPYIGDQFVPGGNDGRTVQGAGSVGTFSVVAETNDPFNGNATVLNAAGGLNSIAPSDTITLVFGGYFNGIGLAYADPVAGPCSISIPGGATTGTVTSTSISFPGIPVATPMQVCIIANGRMWENVMPYVFSYVMGAGVTDFYDGLAQTTANDNFLYSPQPTIVWVAGSPQRAATNTVFATAFSAKVTDASNAPLEGVNVTFEAPYSGASGAFAFSNFVSVATDVSGIATAPAFTANGTVGCYVVKAIIGTSLVEYPLTNTGSDLIFCDGFE